MKKFDITLLSPPPADCVKTRIKAADVNAALDAWLAKHMAVDGFAIDNIALPAANIKNAWFADLFYTGKTGTRMHMCMLRIEMPGKR